MNEVTAAGFLHISPVGFAKRDSGQSRKCAHHWRNKEALESSRIFTLPAQLRRTSAMRPLVLALLAICFLTEFMAEGVGSEVLERSICVSLTTKKLPVKNIKTYTIKEGSMKAVIFITRRGLKVCADPQAEWVKKAVENVDKSTRRNMKQTQPTGAQHFTNSAVTLTT
ncbi:cytokine SCM-1 beta isoform X1 [Lynx rufus]|nr:cytokine SCM-1 beta isoform X1 [Lynx rufus]